MLNQNDPGAKDDAWPQEIGRIEFDGRDVIIRFSIAELAAKLEQRLLDIVSSDRRADALSGDAPLLWTTKDVAQMLQWSERQVQELAMQGKIPGASQPGGKQWRYNPVKVREWAASLDAQGR